MSPLDVVVSRDSVCQCHHLRRCRLDRMCLLDIEVVEVALDKTDYKSGDSMNVAVTATTPGRLTGRYLVRQSIGWCPLFPRIRKHPDAIKLGLTAERLPPAPLAFGSLHAIGDVADNADREGALPDLHITDRDLHRKARAVLAAADGLDRIGRLGLRGQPIDGGRRGPGEAAVVARRDDEAQRLPDHLVLLVAE